jgi:cellulose synthase/poly-beta-1,6-N-acetylglucosamine synthase-like glycosyltransferase
MTTTDPTVSVVICAYSDDRRDLVRTALNSIRRQNISPLEIIAVIDHNPSLQETVSAWYPDVKTIPNSGPRDLSPARNTGVRCATGDIVAFLDDDACARPDWLARMLAHYADSTVVAVGGRIVPVWPQGRPRWFPEEFDWVVGCSYRGQPEQIAVVRNLIGCNMSFRRALLDQVGGFRETLGRDGADARGCEETELCIRAARPVQVRLKSAKSRIEEERNE